MTLKDCYDALGGDYAEVTGRIPSERIIQKFVLKFLDDGSYQLLLDSLAAGNGEEAFRAAHTIKGMCQNLGFARLSASSTALTEKLRGGLDGDYGPLLEQVKQDYANATEAIQRFKAELG